jgi:glycosyltransferase involved in cell wall biosynthesis
LAQLSGSSGLATPAAPDAPVEANRTPARPLRVLQVTARFPPYSGGVENHVYQVSRRLSQAGADVTVLTTDPRGNLASFEIIEGVKVQRVRAWPARTDYYFAPAIYAAIRRGSWDLVHVQSYHTFVPPLAMLAALQAHIPYLVTFHGGGNSSRLRNALRVTQRRLLRPLLARAEWLVANARFEISFYGHELNIPENKFVLIPNGADLPLAEQPSLLCPVQAPRRAGTLIASVGRLERYKGHQRMIAALPDLIEMIPDTRLWIAGSGPYEAELRRLARRYGVEERVDIHSIPPTQRQEMARELSAAAVVVLFSEYESHPIAVLEALSLGRPVVVADTSGLSELAQQGLATAIPLNSSPHQVAAAIAEQVHHPLKPALMHLPTWDECASHLFDLYQHAARRHA